jgi:AraC-like DNA-binding protein
MRLAERALRDENRTVSVVAQTLGYTSESAFSTAFKRATGHSPKAYRKRARASEFPVAEDAAVDTGSRSSS